MKCSVFVAASQTMTTVWSAFTTGLPDGGAGQQAHTAGGTSQQGSSVATNDNTRGAREDMIALLEGSVRKRRASRQVGERRGASPTCVEAKGSYPRDPEAGHLFPDLNAKRGPSVCHTSRRH